MLLYLALGTAALFGLLWLARRFANARTSDIAQAVRTFVAVFSGLASTGLIFAGRFGLAVITVIATVMAIRALMKGSQGADPLGEAGAEDESGRVSEIETPFLRMRLDRRTGEVDGEVKTGAFAGRALAELGRSELLQLLAEAEQHDAQSRTLIEAYLDRVWSDWRQTAQGGAGASAEGGAGDRSGGGAAAGGEMSEAVALEILGLEPGATAEDVKRAHRQLMARLHPDHGGSTFLATQINGAKELLLKRRKRSGR